MAGYPDAAASPDLPALEEAVLRAWEADGTFAASVAARPTAADGGEEFVFYDGPPFANGLPHPGHLLTGFVKDAVPRYQTMRGRRVERRFGWDCHGLPAETEAERDLGVSGRGPITEFGIARFNDHCRTSVLRYTAEWRRTVTRAARWVDFDRDYKTMDLPYMESVMWAIKQLWEKGLLYEGYRVLPYCWECETPLSNFETRQDNSYRDRQDPAVTVAFTLEADPSAHGVLADEVDLWAWTTTPWTLPSNLAVAVNPDVDYGVYERDGRLVVVATALAGAYAGELGEDPAPVATVPGAALVGRRYRPLFPYFASTPGAFVVLGAAFVTVDDGTGVVQMAPGFGEDDQVACAAAGIPVVCPVDDRTRFTAEVPDFEGLQVFEANTPVTRALRAAGALVRADSYVHSYPHCWRTDTPLVYRAVSSWFVRVTALKERLLANNAEITWVPGHVRDGAFGKWLEGARDWSISRNRFWGSPIPVWKSDDPRYPRVDVYGSLDELEADFGVRPADLHRPSVDELVRPNPDDPTGRSMMRRVTDVLDCWFESGSMPFAQVHYPFEHREWFDEHFPGDFIVEYIGQTRGWFYTLHVLATALFDRPAFKTCLAHGILLGNDGQKLSKRLRNYTDVDEVMRRSGADAMRWAMLSSPILRGGDGVFDDKAVGDAVRSALLPLWHAWSFFTLYANADGRAADPTAPPATGVLDRYVLAKLAAMVDEVGASFDRYDLSGACGAVTAFLDALTNWYVRRSRDRFWGTSGGADAEADTRAAFDTLATVLEVLCRAAAPLMPMVAEAVWTGLRAGTPAEVVARDPARWPSSVHLTDWPNAADLPADPDLVAAMDRVREVCSAAHSVRKAGRLRARLPLASVTVAGPGAAALAPFVDLIADEVNVKTVDLVDDAAAFATPKLTVVFKVAAPRLGAATQAANRAAKAGDWELRDDGRARVGDAVLEPGEYDLRVVPADPATTRVLDGQLVVVVDTETDEALEAEGLARDLVRLVQQARRDAGLQVTDRVVCSLGVPAAVADAVATHRGRIAEQVLAVELNIEARDGDVTGAPDAPVLPDGTPVEIRLVVAPPAG
ncbi:MAG TPA: isoleucine--tRNA ligase [Acidimicrobiales bacterium]|nr:isoleucine--tRNA ligase [Acidimicrobiales bacterium]